MRLFDTKYRSFLTIIVIGVAMSVTSFYAFAEEAAKPEPGTDETQPETIVKKPELSEIIPLSTELAGRLTDLENKVKGKLDLDALGIKFSQIQAAIRKHELELQKFKDYGDYRTTKLITVRRKIQKDKERLDVVSKPLVKEIQRLDDMRKQWLTESEKWDAWESAWSKEEAPEQVKSVFADVKERITKAQDIIDPQVGTLLAEQEKIGAIQQKIQTLEGELDSLIKGKRFGTILHSWPPMFSRSYFSKFTPAMFKSFGEGLDEILWSDSESLTQFGWVLLISFLGFAFLTVTLYRNRGALKESEHWRFVAERPVSVGLFFVGVIVTLVYEYIDIPLGWKIVNAFILAIAFARVVSNLSQVKWHRFFVYGLSVFLITNVLLEYINCPIPLFRIFIVLAGLIGSFYCWKWSGQNLRQQGPAHYTGLLRLISVFYIIIVIAEIWGIESLAFYLFVSVNKTIAAVLTLLLFKRLVKGALGWVFHMTGLRKAVILYSSDIESIVSRTDNLFNSVIAVLILLPGILTIWGAFDSLRNAIKSFWGFGFKVGSQQISVGLVIIVIAVLYSTFFISWIVQKFFLDVLLGKQRIQRGVRLSIERLIHYFVIFIGFLVAIDLVGFDMTKFTIVLSALGVGIGFGLQSVVNNFVSGLILLFERPVRHGDVIEIGGLWAEVKHIGLRATTVQTYDQADLIIPNADLTTNQVTNWTLSNRLVRLIIPVGVAYGSDVPRVFQILSECAKSSDQITEKPEPQVLFNEFGDSSLNFELRVWIKDVNYRLVTRSQLHEEIDRRFREANIEIAFPQRDLHIRSMDESIRPFTGEQ